MLPVKLLVITVQRYANGAVRWDYPARVEMEALSGHPEERESWDQVVIQAACRHAMWQVRMREGTESCTLQDIVFIAMEEVEIEFEARMRPRPWFSLGTPCIYTE